MDSELVRELDMDMLRFARVVLSDWNNGHPDREAEKESLEVVNREIKARKGEFAQMDEDELGLAPPPYYPVAAPAEVVTSCRIVEVTRPEEYQSSHVEPLIPSSAEPGYPCHSFEKLRYIPGIL